MKLIDRYIIIEFLKYFATILTVLVLIFYVAEFLRGEADTSAFKLLIYNAYQLPATLVQMVAPAAMLSTMVTLTLLNRRNELIAMQASGIGLIHISSLIFGPVFILCCCTLMITDRVLPPLAKKRTMFLWRDIKGRTDFSLDIKSSKIWYRSKQYIYNLKTFDQKTNTIQGFGIYFFNNDFQLKQHIEAQSAHYEKENSWVLKDGMVTIFPEDTGFPMSKHFDFKNFQLPDSPSDFKEIERQVDTLRLKDLWRFIQRNKDSGLKTDSYEVDFHSRVSLSFIPMVMALLVIPYSVRPRRQGAVGKDVSLCVGFILIYWILFSISMSLGRSGTVTPWISVWSPSFLFLMLASVLIIKK